MLLEIVNFDEVTVRDIKAHLFPADLSRGETIYKLASKVYIDTDDFSEVHKQGFFGLTPSSQFASSMVLLSHSRR